MDRNDVLARIAQEAQTYHLPADTALQAYADILSELAGRIDRDDLEALIAIGTVLIRHAGPVALTPVKKRHLEPVPAGSGRVV